MHFHFNFILQFSSWKKSHYRLIIQILCCLTNKYGAIRKQAVYELACHFVLEIVILSSHWFGHLRLWTVLIITQYAQNLTIDRFPYV